MRIASLSPAATEILFALGVGDQIVCTDQFSNFPDEAKEIPHLRDHQEIDSEELRAHSPDIVLTETVVQEKLAVKLREAGFSVIHQDPCTINQIYESMRALGALFNVMPKVEALILKTQQGFNAVKKKAAHLPSRPQLYIEEWPDPPFASGNWVPEIVRIAGGLQFPINDGELSRAVTLEEVQKWNPELIVISWCGAGNLAPKELLEKRQGWESLQAICEGRVRVIDDSLLNRPGPRLVEGAQKIYGWLFEMLHS